MNDPVLDFLMEMRAVVDAAAARREGITAEPVLVLGLSFSLKSLEARLRGAIQAQNSWHQSYEHAAAQNDVLRRKLEALEDERKLRFGAHLYKAPNIVDMREGFSRDAGGKP